MSLDPVAVTPVAEVAPSGPSSGATMPVVLKETATSFKPYLELLAANPLEAATVRAVITAFRTLNPRMQVAVLYGAAENENNRPCGVLLIAALHDTNPAVAQAAATLFFANPHFLSRETADVVPPDCLSSVGWPAELRFTFGKAWVDCLEHHALRDNLRPVVFPELPHPNDTALSDAAACEEALFGPSYAGEPWAGLECGADEDTGASPVDYLDDGFRDDLMPDLTVDHLPPSVLGRLLARAANFEARFGVSAKLNSEAEDTDLMVRLVADGMLGPYALRAIWDGLDPRKKMILIGMVTLAPREDATEPCPIILAGLTEPEALRKSKSGRWVVQRALEAVIANPALLPEQHRAAVLPLTAPDVEALIADRAREILFSPTTTGNWAGLQLCDLAVDGKTPRIRALATEALDRIGWTLPEYTTTRRTPNGIALGILPGTEREIGAAPPAVDDRTEGAA